MKFKLPGMDLAENWEENTTWEDIIELENQGCDVSEMKVNFLARQEAIQDSEDLLHNARFTEEQVNDERTNLSKLDSYAKEINNPNSQIIRDTIGKPPLLFGKAKWFENIQNCKIIYACVVQCHPQLWKKITEDITPASILFVYSMNPKYSKNIEVLKKVSKYLNDFRDKEDINETEYSKSMIELHKELDNPESTPHIRLDETILSDLDLESDADFRVTNNYVYDDTPLLNNKLPANGILPYLQYKKLDLKSSLGYSTRLIPSKYYTE